VSAHSAERADGLGENSQVQGMMSSHDVHQDGKLLTGALQQEPRRLGEQRVN
jgi:hypothetical protein